MGTRLGTVLGTQLGTVLGTNLGGGVVDWPLTMVGTYPTMGWYNTDSLSTGLLSSWPEYFSGSYTLTAAGAERPNVEAGIAGKKSVRFVRASSQRIYQAGGNPFAAMMGGSNPFTLMYIEQPASMLATGAFATTICAGVNSSGTDFAITGTSAQVTGNYWNRDFCRRGAAPLASTTERLCKSRAVKTVIFDGTNIRSYVDGRVSIAPTASTAAALDWLVFGAWRLSGSFQFPADTWLGDVIIIPAALSDSDRQAGEAWLANKWKAADAKIVLAVGDSYTEGFINVAAPTDPLYAPSFPSANVWMIRSDLAVRAAWEPLGVNGTNKGSYVEYFGWKLKDTLPATTDVVLINLGHQGYQSSQQLAELTTRLPGYLGAAYARTGKTTIDYVVRSDGYNDATAGVDGTTYNANWDAVLAQLQTLAPGSYPELSLRLMSSYPAAPTSLASIRAGQLARDNGTTRKVATIPDGTTTGDGVHMDRAGDIVKADLLMGLV